MIHRISSGASTCHRRAGEQLRLPHGRPPPGFVRNPRSHTRAAASAWGACRRHLPSRTAAHWQARVCTVLGEQVQGRGHWQVRSGQAASLRDPMLRATVTGTRFRRPPTPTASTVTCRRALQSALRGQATGTGRGPRLPPSLSSSQSTSSVAYGAPRGSGLVLTCQVTRV